MKREKTGRIWRVLLLVVTVCSLLLLCCGCGAVENMKLFKEGAGEEAAPGAEDQTTVIEENLDITEQAAEDGDQAAADDPRLQESTTGAVSGETRQVVLYFATADGSSLEAETREIVKEEGLARATVNQLIAGPQSAELYPTLPAATILEDINISNGICTVDFSRELLDDLGTDSQSQLLAVYSIVNTLTQFDTVDYVQILVNGQTVSGGLGGVDVTATLAPVTL